MPGVATDLPSCVDVRGALCVFLSGSLVEGWGHRDSDVDVYVVREEGPAHADFLSTLGLVDHEVETAVHFVDGRRWDVCYWTPGLLDDLFARLGEYRDDVRGLAKLLQPSDVAFLYRLSAGVAIAGHEYLRERQFVVERSGAAAAIACAAAEEADAAIEDALGLEASGDLHSSVLAARRALDHAIDAFSAHQGALAPAEKWRYLKYRQALDKVTDPPLSLTEYWRLQTMREFSPENPGEWVQLTLDKCYSLLSVLTSAQVSG
ncbi:hypothetical protein GCM10011609_27860 [Lentzea pudingi]|uniref:Nucleotidyltransferase domain-containing protein n=1 Tax=Lentzea pudingi TaxID=1789439 RepID=A0ABQ2HSD0_9PSEU|nr:hypothetical protein GCM10011609_27860 [Lentzea pudingi]